MKFNQLVVSLVTVFSLIAFSGCTSNQTEGDQSNAEVSDESLEIAEAVDNNDDLSLDFDGGDNAFADMGSGLDSSSPSDLDLALTEDSPATTYEDSGLGADDLSESTLAESTPSESPLEDLAPDFGSPSEETMVAESEPDFGAPIESAEPDFGESTPEPSYIAESESYSSESEIDTSPAPVAVSLKKMISVPYMHAGKPVNAIYMAREGDTLPSISQKIFGGDRVNELCAINAFNCSRSIKVGDKYYYNSPQRPNDTESVRTFYEDAGIPAQTYVAQEGDNIRDLGSSLLGHQRSWMELWSLNPDVESKGELTAGTTLRYWRSTPAVELPTLAQNEPPPPAMVEPEPELPAMPSEMPPPMEDMAFNEIPDVPQGPDMSMTDDFAQDAGGDVAMGSIADMEPPPPPPPPPPPMESSRPMDMASNDNFGDQDQTMALGVGAILLLAGVALFIAIRKRRARRPVDFNTTTQTQIE